MKSDRAQSSARTRLESLVVSAWYDPNANPLLRFLFFVLGTPLSWFTRQKSHHARKQIHRIKKTASPSPPVLVIGNFVAGGSGKTPLTIAITNALIKRGTHVGLICRGDGALQRDQSPQLVDARSTAAMVGDEAMLLAQSTQAAVCVGAKRDDARRTLLNAHPNLELIISDDGLQHQALPRTLELAVFDRRGTGNGRLLPAGPLREAVAHLALMDALVLNLGMTDDPEADATHTVSALTREGITHSNVFCSNVSVRDIVPLEYFSVSRREAQTHLAQSTGQFVSTVAGNTVAAIAGIANPPQFFSVLRRLGLNLRTIALPDHSAITPELLANIEDQFIITTAKDAVKCPPDPRVFVLRVDANPPVELIDWIAKNLDGFPAA